MCFELGVAALSFPLLALAFIGPADKVLAVAEICVGSGVGISRATWCILADLALSSVAFLVGLISTSRATDRSPRRAVAGILMSIASGAVGGPRLPLPDRSRAQVEGLHGSVPVGPVPDDHDSIRALVAHTCLRHSSGPREHSRKTRGSTEGKGDGSRLALRAGLEPAAANPTAMSADKTRPNTLRRLTGLHQEELPNQRGTSTGPLRDHTRTTPVRYGCGAKAASPWGPQRSTPVRYQYCTICRRSHGWHDQLPPHAG